jgi:hypothetical protein
MSQQNPFAGILGVNTLAILDGLAVFQTYATELATHLAALHTDATELAPSSSLAALTQRLDELPTKSKKAMILASSKGWFFGWPESLPELMAVIEKLAAIREPDVDEFMGQHYRNHLQPLTDELVGRHPNRASVIKAAVKAHNEFGTDGYFLSIPVFIAQADGLLTEIAGVKSAMMKASRNTQELQASKALREKLGTDQESLALIHPILIMHKLDFMKSASERGRAVRTPGESFTALNRHQVMHGESWDYGTEINSLKAFSFLAFVGLHLPMILETADQHLMGRDGGDAIAPDQRPENTATLNGPTLSSGPDL